MPSQTPRSLHAAPGVASDTVRHLAVRSRNRAYDGAFWYGVRTTGVYCRPSCPSRTARAENVVFFDSPDAAERAGYRACRRCDPRARHRATPAATVMRRVCEHIARHAADPLPLAELARLSGYSAAHLQRTFKQEVGVSPKAYQTALRVLAAKRTLRAGARVTDAAYGAGFGAVSRAHAQIRREVGMSPSAYRAGGAGETIHHACRRTSLGLLMMAATDKGVCFVQFGESESALLEALATEFPRAGLVRSKGAGSTELNAWVDALNAHLSSGTPSPDLPLDVRGTAFQLRVWQCLRAIREGETISYTELAARVGAPAAVRAAASACARNRIALLIPCHRVLRQDGSLGGYRWGLGRKRDLLAREAGAVGTG